MKDQRLLLFQCDNNAWWFASTEDRSVFGWIPANYVETLSELAAVSNESQTTPSSPFLELPHVASDPILPSSDDWHGSSRTKSSAIISNQHKHLHRFNRDTHRLFRQMNLLLKANTTVTSLITPSSRTEKEGRNSARNGLFAIAAATELLFVNEKDKVFMLICLIL